ncbi:hypothetical protein GE061_016268 [Apolygus lucorum]|uniref:Uncharacterized protein n=1 Tax=Apolygus lucorum TaxID=248454 RepID=A0A8S9XGU5_APOLU|nr:hypothetical protein GE061_016268 [Apolygus lucorum]
MTNSVWSGMIMFWPCSVLFISLPVIYCLIFNQRLNANSTQVRRVVTVLEMGNALVGWITQLALTEEFDNTTRYSVIVMWVITIPLLVTLVTLLESIRRFIRGDFTIDKSIRSVIIGIHHDLHHLHHRGRSTPHVVFFSLLLLPAMSLTMIASTLDSVKNEHGGALDPLLVNLLYLFQIITIPIIEVALAMTQIKENMTDYSVLIIAHLSNVAVLGLIVTNLESVSPRGIVEEVEQPIVRSKRGTFENPDLPPPDAKNAVFMIINGIESPIEFEPSVRFDPPSPYKFTIGSGQYHLGRTSDRGELEVVIRSIGSSNSTLITKPARLRVNTFYLFVALLLEYGRFDLTLETYAIRLTPKVSKLFVVNTLQFPGAQVKIETMDGNPEKIIDVPPSPDVAGVFFPSKDCVVSLTYVGSNPELKNIYQDDKTAAHFEGDDVGVAYLHFAKSKMNLKVVRLFRLPPTTPTTTTVPFSTKMPPLTSERPPKTAPPVLMVTYSLAGAVIGTTSVAYTHFFWMESPLRLRATMFAAFRVANEVVYRLTPVVTGEGLTQIKAYSLLSIQVFTTFAHLILGYIFQTKVHSS